MRIFITGTDTNIGKTLIASWLCLHSGYDYIKPIQSGGATEKDSDIVRRLSPQTIIHPESYLYAAAVAPYLAAKLEHKHIDLNKIHLPRKNNLIIEGAGGILVPLNSNQFILDLIKLLQVPVIIVVRASLGTINHTLLTLEVLRKHHIDILGVIISGKKNIDNAKAIKIYGKINVIAELDWLNKVSFEILQSMPLSDQIKDLLRI